MSTLEENKATVKKMQKIVFGILCDVDDFCKENGIRYFLSGGTCLGAVRHQGFIPWDDDGDIMMPRPDYERFLQLFPKCYKNKYFVGSLKTDKNWQRPASRICDLNSHITPRSFTEKTMGIFVDLFPIDGLPDGKKKQHRHYQKLHLLNSLRNTSIWYEFCEEDEYRRIKTIAAIVTQKIGPRWFAEKIDHDAGCYFFETAKEVAAILAVHYWDKETIAKELMNTAIELPFEGRMFPVPIGYDQYLKNLYGDYMEIPNDAEKNTYPHLDGFIVEFDTR